MAGLNVRPNPWLWTIAALGGLAWGLIAVIFAAVGPGEYVPRIFHNSHAEHFVAFYALTLMASAAFSRAPLLHVCLSLALMALVLAVVRLFIPRHQLADAEDLAADLGGIAAAVAPILVGRFRQIVAQREAGPPE
jgi:hypothetical protein